MIDTSTLAEDRAGIIKTANLLREALILINRHGDNIDSSGLTYQRNGSAYGEVYDGLRIIVAILYPDQRVDGLVEGRADKIIDAWFDSDWDSVEQAAQHVADVNSPMYGYSTEDVRAELVKYRAWLHGLKDGVVDPIKIVGVSDDEDKGRTAAAIWLDERISECEGALAYRNEPEVSPNA